MVRQGSAKPLYVGSIPTQVSKSINNYMIEWFVKKGLFRNANHAIWFFSTLLVLLLTTLWIFFGFRRAYLVALPLVVHVPPFLTATWKSSLRKEQSDIYSKDCIWFNLSMILIYLAILVVYFK